MLLFVDDDSARHAPIKGGSPSPASAMLVSLFWAEEASLRSFAWVERVASASNIADGPSRLAFAEICALGAPWSESQQGISFGSFWGFKGELAAGARFWSRRANV